MWVAHTSKRHQEVRIKKKKKKEVRIKSNPFSWLCISILDVMGKKESI